MCNSNYFEFHNIWIIDFISIEESFHLELVCFVEIAKKSLSKHAPPYHNAREKKEYHHVINMYKKG